MSKTLLTSMLLLGALMALMLAVAPAFAQAPPPDAPPPMPDPAGPGPEGEPPAVKKSVSPTTVAIILVVVAVIAIIAAVAMKGKGQK